MWRTWPETRWNRQWNNYDKKENPGVIKIYEGFRGERRSLE